MQQYYLVEDTEELLPELRFCIYYDHYKTRWTTAVKALELFQHYTGSDPTIIKLFTSYPQQYIITPFTVESHPEYFI